MNLKETIISSFFFHLILFLLVLALSGFTAGFPGSFDNVISVDLATEESKVPPATETVSADKPAPPSATPAKEEMSPPDQAAPDPPEEAKRIPEPENKPAADTGPAKIENTTKLPTQGEGTDKLEAYYQFLMLHRQIFGKKAGARVNRLLGEAFKVNTREFFGGTATVSLKYDSQGELDKVDVDSESPDLKAFLEEIGWYDIPAPASYLGHTVQIEFTVLEGYMSFRVNIS